MTQQRANGLGASITLICAGLLLLMAYFFPHGFLFLGFPTFCLYLYIIEKIDAKAKRFRFFKR